jgi:hypothetical protein
VSDSQDIHHQITYIKFHIDKWEYTMDACRVSCSSRRNCVYFHISPVSSIQQKYTPLSWRKFVEYLGESKQTVSVVLTDWLTVLVVLTDWLSGLRRSPRLGVCWPWWRPRGGAGHVDEAEPEDATTFPFWLIIRASLARSVHELWSMPNSGEKELCTLRK